MGSSRGEQDDVISIFGEAARVRSLPENPLAPVPEDCVSEPLGRDEGDPARGAFVAWCYSNSQKGVVEPLPPREDLLKFLPGFDGLHRSVLNGEPLAALGTTARQHGAAPLGGHTLAESMCGGALALIRLIRTLHSYSSPLGVNSIVRNKPKDCKGLASDLSIYPQKNLFTPTFPDEIFHIRMHPFFQTDEICP